MQDSSPRRRAKNRELRRSIRNYACVANGCGSKESDPCHVVPFNVCGDDKEFNLIPLCRRHHTEQHHLGWRIFIDRYTQVALVLKSLGWEWEFLNGKFLMHHPEMRRK